MTRTFKLLMVVLTCLLTSCPFKYAIGQPGNELQKKSDTSIQTITAARANNGIIERLQISLYFYRAVNDRRIADGIAMKFGNSFLAGVGSEDAIKFSNFDEEVSILRNTIRLSIEGRPLIEETDTLPIDIKKMKTQAYEWQFDPSNFTVAGLRAELFDKFLNTTTPISLTAITVYPFSITGSASSKDADRFKIYFYSIIDYKSNGAVSTASAINWLRYNVSAYAAALVPPLATNDIMIRKDHTLTIGSDFTIGTGKALFLNTGAAMVIDPGKRLTVTGTADFNNQPVTIRSTTVGTGSIAALTFNGNNLTGATKVTVERYISGVDNRAYRQLAPTVNTASGVKPFIRDNWQEGANNPNTVANNNPQPGYGTHITGSKTGANGFDATISGNPSLFLLNTAGNAWEPIANTNATVLDAKKGYLLFVRGNRSVSLNTNASNGNTTVRATGTLLKGDQLFGGLAPLQNNFIGNPFSSAISWAALYGSNLGGNAFSNTAFVYLDPNLGQRGSYVTVQADGTTTTFNNMFIDAAAPNIQSGQAFWVKPAAGVSTITVHESDKSGNNDRDVFREGGDGTARLYLSLLYADAPLRYRVADGVVAKFAAKYAAGIDREDADKLTNFDEDVSILRNGTSLAIEARPSLTVYDTLPIYLKNLQPKSYRWQCNAGDFEVEGIGAFLQDQYLKSETFIGLNSRTDVDFLVTSNAASAAADRFRVVFRSIVVLPVNFTQVKAFEKGSAVQVEWNLATETGVKLYEIEKSTDGRSFTKNGTLAVRTISSGDNYTWRDVAPTTGNNYYRIKVLEQNGPGRYSQVVNVKMGKGNAGITVYPNPVNGSSIGLQFTNQPTGKYGISLYNHLGQQVYRSEFNHIGGSASQTLQLSNKLAAGIYQLSVTNGATTNTQKVVVE